jgi:hypothetical protein
MLHPTWSGYPTWLITQQSTVGIISNLDYNFNLIPTWDLILTTPNLLTFQIDLHSLQIKQLQRHPPTRHKQSTSGQFNTGIIPICSHSTYIQIHNKHSLQFVIT